MKQLALNNSSLVALVDDEDYDELLKYKWRIHDLSKKKFYVIAAIEGRQVRLHNFIMSPDDSLEVDHLNGNTLDCRKSNMRITTHANNCRNRQKETAGVSFDQSSGKWRARIGLNYRRVHLGRFSTREEAVTAVKKAREDFFNA